MSGAICDAGPAMTTATPLRRAVTQLARPRTWAELGYAMIGLPLGVLGFAFTVVTFVLGTGLLVTFVGVGVLAVSNEGVRFLSGGARIQANRLLGTDVATPTPVRSHDQGRGYLRAHLLDPVAWRGRLYLVLKLPVALTAFVVAVGFYVYGLGGITYPIWRPFTGCNTDSDGTCHHGAGLGPHYYLDTPLRIALAVVIGVVVLLAAPWAVRAVLSVDKVLVTALLGPTGRDARVQELERARATAVDDSATTLRRIERDLHDGTQARLVALAMNVGLAREKLAEGGDPAEAERLLDTAHTTAKQAIVELRDLARGIHPPVLDAGLDTALATLAAHSALDVRVHAELSRRPDPAIETMVYFCVAELLTNAAKHSGARTVTVDVATRGDRLQVDVDDDGCGGAALGRGTGLTGLTERVATVDGVLELRSPAGGPTRVHVDVPLSAGRTAAP